MRSLQIPVRCKIPRCKVAILALIKLNPQRYYKRNSEFELMCKLIDSFTVEGLGRISVWQNSNGLFTACLGLSRSDGFKTACGAFVSLMTDYWQHSS